MRIAIWSADYSQLTGQALVTARVIRHQPNVAWLEYVYLGRGWSSAITWVAALSRLWRDIVLGRFRTIYLVCSRTNGGFLRDVPALLASRAGARVIVHVHGSDIVDLLSNRWLSPFARALYSQCEIVVPSSHLLEPIHEVTGMQPHLCENYFEADFGTADGVSSSGQTTAFTVIWNSNVMSSKGFLDLAEAVRQVREGGIAVRLISIGQPLGDEEMTEQQTVHRLDALLAHEWFDYRGKVDQATAIALVAEADVVCLPSRYSSECQPLAIIQGMCAGKAIIASDIPALRATLGGYPAEFVPIRSPSAIASALRDLHRILQIDPAAFAASRTESAAIARRRFAAARFDREVSTILHGQKTA